MCTVHNTIRAVSNAFFHGENNVESVKKIRQSNRRNDVIFISEEAKIIINYITGNMNAVRIVFWFVLVLVNFTSRGSLHGHWGNRMIAPVPVKKPWQIWIYKCISIRYKLTIGPQPINRTQLCNCVFIKGTYRIRNIKIPCMNMCFELAPQVVVSWQLPHENDPVV